jgi:hypothetical protein
MKQQIIKAVSLLTCDLVPAADVGPGNNLLYRKILVPEVQSAMAWVHWSFVTASSLSGTLKMENGTSVTIGN